MEIEVKMWRRAYFSAIYLNEQRLPKHWGVIRFCQLEEQNYKKLRLRFQHPMVALSFRRLSSIIRHSYPFLFSRAINSVHLRGGSVYSTMTTAMGKRLEGKTIVITGASSGIGRSTGFRILNLQLISRSDRIQQWNLRELPQRVLS